MPHLNCAEDFTSTNGCPDSYNVIRGIITLQVEALIQSSIVLSVETGLYSECKSRLFERKAMLTSIMISFVRGHVCNVDVHTMVSE